MKVGYEILLFDSFSIKDNRILIKNYLVFYVVLE